MAHRKGRADRARCRRHRVIRRRAGWSRPSAPSCPTPSRRPTRGRTARAVQTIDFGKCWMTYWSAQARQVATSTSQRPALRERNGGRHGRGEQVGDVVGIDQAQLDPGRQGLLAVVGQEVVEHRARVGDHVGRVAIGRGDGVVDRADVSAGVGQERVEGDLDLHLVVRSSGAMRRPTGWPCHPRARRTSCSAGGP